MGLSGVCIFAAVPALYPKDGAASLVLQPTKKRGWTRREGKDDKVGNKSHQHRIGQRDRWFHISRLLDQRWENDQKSKGIALLVMAAVRSGVTSNPSIRPVGLCLDEVQHVPFAFSATFPDPGLKHSPKPL